MSRSVRNRSDMWVPSRTPHFIPALGQLHCTFFVRQAAHLCHLKMCAWHPLLPRTGCDPWLQRVNSVPLPVCQCAWAHCFQHFEVEAAFSYHSQPIYWLGVPDTDVGYCPQPAKLQARTVTS